MARPRTCFPNVIDKKNEPTRSALHLAEKQLSDLTHHIRQMKKQIKRADTHSYQETDMHDVLCKETYEVYQGALDVLAEEEGSPYSVRAWCSKHGRTFNRMRTLPSRTTNSHVSRAEANHDEMGNLDLCGAHEDEYECAYRDGPRK